VGSKPVGREDLALEEDRHRPLGFVTDPASVQFHAHRALIHRLQQPWSQFTMNLNRGSDDGAHELLEFRIERTGDT
jgi:hypothetical protein